MPVGAEYVYTEKPYEVIQNLNYERSQVEVDGERYLGQLESIDTDIERYERQSIFNLFMKIEQEAKLIDIKGHEMFNSIEYVKIEVQEYNSKELTQRKKGLDEFCLQLLDESNIFSDSLTLFKNYKNLSRKIHKEKLYKKIPEKIEFKVWEQQEMDLLGVYSLEDYLELEKYYHKNKNVEIGNWELEKAEKLHIEMKNLYNNRILRIKNMLRRTLKKTNWIFGKI